MMRTFRTATHRTFRLGTLGLATAALLAATACESGDDTAGDAPPAKPTATSSASTRPGGSSGTGGGGGDADTTGGDGGSATGGATGNTGGTSGGAGDTAEDTCTDANTDVAAEFALPAHKDDAKLLLTVTNTGRKPCNLFGYPAVRFGEAQSVPPVIESSKPRAAVVLAPGSQGYAGVLTNRSKPDATIEKTLTVAFQGESVGSDTGEGTAVTLPAADGVVVDGSIHVTYWQGDSESAVSPLFSH
ncbi:DUF4232 domain-containing protein [Streptomyces sp. NPDC018031]|uniref:DUF4232 domain-containing protein n=1 Tax=Streptomyces sp. NPDC018031 TaxID=3365033 RepID=UPI003798D07B